MFGNIIFNSWKREDRSTTDADRVTDISDNPSVWAWGADSPVCLRNFGPYGGQHSRNRDHWLCPLRRSYFVRAQTQQMYCFEFRLYDFLSIDDTGIAAVVFFSFSIKISSTNLSRAPYQHTTLKRDFWRAWRRCKYWSFRSVVDELQQTTSPDEQLQSTTLSTQLAHFLWVRFGPGFLACACSSLNPCIHCHSQKP